MSFDREALARAVATHGAVARVVVAATRGSVPREAGTAMLVWPGGQSGTIGGGTLEYRATAAALAALASGHDRWDKLPLGTALGQCCGGAVTLLTEIWHEGRLEDVAGPVFARGPGEMPLAVARLLKRARGEGALPRPGLVSGWMVEPVQTAARPLWLWGAGHVGRAIVATLAPLPDFALTWCDTGAGRFPATLPDGVTARIFAPDAVGAAVAAAPRDAAHLILTYSHSLDLALCHALLGHGFAGAGLIGSQTKRARFRSRLKALGHSEAEISRIRCPIGRPELGKHPQAIAVGVAATLLLDGLQPAAEPGDVARGAG